MKKMTMPPNLLMELSAMKKAKKSEYNITARNKNGSASAHLVIDGYRSPSLKRSMERHLLSWTKFGMTNHTCGCQDISRFCSCPSNPRPPPCPSCCDVFISIDPAAAFQCVGSCVGRVALHTRTASTRPSYKCDTGANT
jgi:hypothetical protein